MISTPCTGDIVVSVTVPVTVTILARFCPMTCQDATVRINIIKIVFALMKYGLILRKLRK